jgi:hypothetical protein
MSATKKEKQKSVKSTQLESRVATNLLAKPDCDRAEPRKGIAWLSWTIASQPGNKQKIDVTTYLHGFETNTGVISEMLLPGQNSLIWQSTSPGVLYRWRVLTLHENVWISSEIATFEGATCVVDFIFEPESQTNN